MTELIASGPDVVTKGRSMRRHYFDRIREYALDIEIVPILNTDWPKMHSSYSRLLVLDAGCSGADKSKVEW